MTYDAFLSYSHRDAALARRLSRRLRTYRPPRRAKLGNRRLSVFRDVERLTASADLSGVLIDELRAAQKLVLLASPDAAQSRYVNEELRAFLQTHVIDDVVPVLCRGEAKESMPAEFLTLAPEALYIDLRTPGRAQFRNESLRLIAALFEVDYERLRRQDDQRRRWRRNGVLATAVSAMALVFSVYLVAITPAEAWNEVRPPMEYSHPEGLAPVEQFAVQREDPAIVAWLATTPATRETFRGPLSGCRTIRPRTSWNASGSGCRLGAGNRWRRSG